MNATLAFVIILVLLALVFDYINGFHDAANSIATVVSTRVLSPGLAVIWAAFFNFIAFAVFWTRVAKAIGDGVRMDIIPSDLRLYVLPAAARSNHLESHTWYPAFRLRAHTHYWWLRRRRHCSPWRISGLLKTDAWFPHVEVHRALPADRNGCFFVDGYRAPDLSAGSQLRVSIRSFVEVSYFPLRRFHLVTAVTMRKRPWALSRLSNCGWSLGIELWP